MINRSTLLSPILAALLLAVFTAPAAAMLHPKLGRFMQRDSLGYVDGMSMYAGYHIHNGAVDPLGLWKIDRHGSAKATAESEKDDTVRKLAGDIGLDVAEFKQWLTLHGGVNLESGLGVILDWLEADDVICPGEEVEVPNTILAYWGGDAGALGRIYVNWSGKINQYRQDGYLVLEHHFEPPGAWRSQDEGMKRIGTHKSTRRRSSTWVPNPNPSPDNEYQRLLEQLSRNRELYGTYLWCHGDPSTFASRFRNQSGQEEWVPLLDLNTLSLEYRLAIAEMNACYSNAAKGTMLAPNGHDWIGNDGTMIPLPGGGGLDTGK